MYVSVMPQQPTARRWGRDMACVEIGAGTAIVLADAAEADELIRAAVEAKQLLDPPAADSVVYRLTAKGEQVAARHAASAS